MNVMAAWAPCIRHEGGLILGPTSLNSHVLISVLSSTAPTQCFLYEASQTPSA